jgi:heme/copper-type cytochrome/quinol oxidase subunit 2
VAVAALGVVLAACARQPVIVEGERVTFLYDVFLVAAAIVFVVVAGRIGWSIVRQRHTGDGHDLAGGHQSVPLELLWWALPTLLVIILFIQSLATAHR